MSNNPAVSAIVPVYNGERFLAQALDSALAQTLRDFEIIVIDDGSTDTSGAIADRYAALHSTSLRVIRQHNQGLCYARNAGIAAARGRYIALLDADDIWLPHHLAASVAELDRRAQVGLVHANIEKIDADGVTLGQPQRYWQQAGPDAFKALFLRNEHVSCPTAVFRRGLIETVGEFDPRFNRLGCEDRDLWLRIAHVRELVYIDKVHARYRLHGGNMSANFDKMRRARMMLVDKFSVMPRGRALRGRAIAAIHCGLGDELLNSGQRYSAVRAYARALARRPADLHAWKALLRCLLKPPAKIAIAIPPG